MYGETAAQQHGIKTEKPAVKNLKKIIESYGGKVAHVSEINKFDIDVTIEINGKILNKDYRE